MPLRKPPKPKGRAYYYRMRTPEKRFEVLVKLAAIMAGVVVLGLMVAFGSAIVFRSGDEPVQQASMPSPVKRPVSAATPASNPVRPTARSDHVRDCANCPGLTIIPAGSYMMGARAEEAGSPAAAASEGPVHGVTLQRPIAMQSTEVTRGQFAAFIKETGYQAAGCKVFDGTAWVIDRSRSWRDPGFFQDDDHPVVCVSAMDAKAYAKWLSEKSGVRFRLPSEAEWEYAARAGVTGSYVWGADPTAACAAANVADTSLLGTHKDRDIALYFACDDRQPHTAPVGKFSPNSFGLMDMIGNVREITADCWNADYDGAPTDGASRTDGDCGAAAARGGGWFDPPANMRTARRLKTEITERRTDQGFRIVRDTGSRTH